MSRRRGRWARSLPYMRAGKEVINMAYVLIAIVYVILGASAVAKAT